MKLRFMFMSALAIVLLTNCNDDDGYKNTEVSNADVAYLSIRIETHPTTRASGENPGADESDIKKLYLVTFDNAGKVLGIPSTSAYFIEIDPASSTPGAVKVSADATKLLVVANPGTQLAGVISGVGATSTFNSINAAIAGVAEDEVTDNVKDIKKGFAMINSGNDAGLSEGTKITDLLIDITGKMIKPKEGEKDEDTKLRAELSDNRGDVRIERLTSKVELWLKDEIKTFPEGAKFDFESWTLDVVNTTFFPCADKTILEVAHSGSTPFYESNFYTHDPNFEGVVGDGLAFASIDPDTYAPVLLDPYGWMEPSKSDEPAIAYCLENTMAAAEQKFGNASRIVIKGTYYPKEHTTKTGDWFNFAGKDYHNLKDLQDAYDKAEDDSNLKKVCNNMYGEISDFKKGVDVGSDFMDLTENMLKDIPNGGELIKNKKEDVVRWYQNGLNYYYYEIRHDNETEKEMDFGKYGVVRNNWYQLTLGSVNGAGTPWYPDPNNPGPGDPDPEDPIDQSAGYLGITVKTAPWVIWENEIGI